MDFRREKGAQLDGVGDSGGLGRPHSLVPFAHVIGNQLRIDLEPRRWAVVLAPGRIDDINGAGSLSIAAEVAVRLGQGPKPLHSFRLSRLPDGRDRFSCFLSEVRPAGQSELSAFERRHRKAPRLEL